MSIYAIHSLWPGGATRAHLLTHALTHLKQHLRIGGASPMTTSNFPSVARQGVNPGGDAGGIGAGSEAPHAHRAGKHGDAITFGRGGKEFRQALGWALAGLQGFVAELSQRELARAGIIDAFGRGEGGISAVRPGPRLEKIAEGGIDRSAVRILVGRTGLQQRFQRRLRIDLRPIDAE